MSGGCVASSVWRDCDLTGGGGCRDPKSSKELSGWNLTFDDQLLRYTARVLPQEKIMQRNGDVSLWIA